MDLREWFTRFPVVFLPGIVGNGAANVGRDFFGQVKVDAIEYLRVRFIYNRVIAMTELKREGVDEMLLFVQSQRVEEELGLVIMLLKFLPADPFLYTLNLRRITTVALAQSKITGRQLTYNIHHCSTGLVGRPPFDWANN